MNKKCYVSQKLVNDCGIACIMMIFKLYKIPFNETELRSKLKLDYEGVSAYELIKIAKQKGLESEGYKNYDIKKGNSPVIALVVNNNKQHFVVVEKTQKESLIVMDPAVGISHVSIKDFLKNYTGIVITFKTNEKLPINKIFENKKIIIAIVVVTIIWSSLNIIYSYSLSLSVKLIELNKSTISIIFALLLFLILGFLKNIISFFKNKLCLNFCVFIDKVLTLPILKKIISLPSDFYQKHPKGELISKVNDLSYIKNFIIKLVQTVFVNFILALSSLAVLLILNRMIFIFSLIFLLAIYLVSYLFYENNNYLNYKMQQTNEELNSNIINVLDNILTVKNYMKENFFYNKLNDKYQKVIAHFSKLFKSYSKKDLITDCIVIIFEILILIISVYKNVHVSNIIFLSSVFMMYVSSIIGIFDLYDSYLEYKNAKQRINELYKTNSLVNHDGFLSVKKLEYKNVFYKINNKYLFRNVNFVINKGQWILVNGPSGVGKTTLFNMLFTNRKSNNIYIDGKVLSDLSYSEIKSNILYIDQKSKVSNDTVANNIKLDKECYIKAGKAALVDQLLKENKLDYDYVIDNTNGNLSGGQIQKILIAQALNSGRQIIIFDETTSQIDIDSERRILLNIKKYYKNITIILITHKLGNKDLFDKVLTFNNGGVNEKINSNRFKTY